MSAQDFVYDHDSFKLIERGDYMFSSCTLKFYTSYCLQITATEMFKVLEEMEMEPTETFDDKAIFLFQFENGEDDFVTGKVDFCADDKDRTQKDIILVRFDRLFGGNYTCFKKKIEEIANNVDWLRNVENVPKTQN